MNIINMQLDPLILLSSTDYNQRNCYALIYDRHTIGRGKFIKTFLAFLTERKLKILVIWTGEIWYGKSVFLTIFLCVAY